MSIKLCITGKADAGVISREAADEAIRRIDEIEKPAAAWMWRQGVRPTRRW